MKHGYKKRPNIFVCELLCESHDLQYRTSIKAI